MSKKRNHYITASYLALFSPERERSGTLFITDKSKFKVYTSSPSNAGLQVDYFSVEIPGVPPDLLEDKVSELESKAIPVLKDIEAQRSIPGGEEYDCLMTFLGLLILRTPPFKHFIERSTEKVLLFALDAMWNETSHAEYARKMKEQGKSPEEILSF